MVRKVRTHVKFSEILHSVVYVPKIDCEYRKTEEKVMMENKKKASKHDARKHAIRRSFFASPISIFVRKWQYLMVMQ